MSQLIALPTAVIPQQRTPVDPATIEHPSWCAGRRFCDQSDVNVVHRDRADRWLASESDSKITVGIEQTDELLHFRANEQITYPPVVRVEFEDVASVNVARQAGEEFPIRADVLLDARDARKLAGQLLELADRLDYLQSGQDEATRCPDCGRYECIGACTNPPGQRIDQRAEASTNGPESASVPLVECEGCGHDFRPDSSPNLVLCWSCDERAAAESGGRPA